MAFPALRRWRGSPPRCQRAGGGGLGYFVWTGTVSAIWPLLGVSNQLLAAFALAIGTSVLINMARPATPDHAGAARVHVLSTL